MKRTIKFEGDDREYLISTDFADLVGVEPARVYQLVKQGRIPDAKRDSEGRMRIPKGKVITAPKSRRVKGKIGEFYMDPEGAEDDSGESEASAREERTSDESFGEGLRGKSDEEAPGEISEGDSRNKASKDTDKERLYEVEVTVRATDIGEETVRYWVEQLRKNGSITSVKIVAQEDPREDTQYADGVISHHSL